MDEKMTKSRAVALLRAEIREYSPFALSNGRRQLRRDTMSLIRQWCRRDAVGRISTADEKIIMAAIDDLTRSGELAGELNGYLLA